MSELQDITSAVKIGQLETQMNNVEKKVDVGFLEVKNAIGVLSTKVDIISDLKNDIINLKIEVADLRRNRNLFAWVVPTISAATGAILTILITSYLNNVGK